MGIFIALSFVLLGFTPGMICGFRLAEKKIEKVEDKIE